MPTSFQGGRRSPRPFVVQRVRRVKSVRGAHLQGRSVVAKSPDLSMLILYGQA